MVDVLRMEASTQAKLAREDDRDAKSKDYNSDRIRATGSWVADSRRQGDTRDLPILAHNHQLESLHGEEPPLVVGTATGKARPKARPSATSDPPNRYEESRRLNSRGRHADGIRRRSSISVSGPHLRQRTTATTSSTTLSSSEDSSTDSGIELV